MSSKSPGFAYTDADDVLQCHRAPPEQSGRAPEINEDLGRVEASREEGNTFHLRNGRSVTVPLSWSWRLMQATDEEMQNLEDSAGGYVVHWPDVDEDLSRQAALCGTPAPRPQTEKPDE